MKVIVNDIEKELPSNLTVAELLEREGEPAGHVIVEIGGVFIAPKQYSNRALADGDRVEIILPAFGG